MRFGTPIWKPSDDSYWYYWLGEKQGHASGSVLAKSRRGARAEIKAKHPKEEVSLLLSYEQYHK